MPGNTAYCLAKGGMRMLTGTAGVELAAYGIRVVGVRPGAVATSINISTMQDAALLDVETIADLDSCQLSGGSNSEVRMRQAMS